MLGGRHAIAPTTPSRKRSDIFGYITKIIIDYVTKIVYRFAFLAREGVSGDDPVGGAGSGVPRCGANRNAGRSGPRPPGRYGLARAVAAAPVPHCREPASWVRIRKPPRWSAESGPGRPGTGGRASQARPKERVRPVGAPSPLIGGTELLLSRRPPAPKPPWARRRRRKQMRRRRRTRAQQRAAGTKKTALFDIVNAVMGNGSLRAPRLRARG